MDLAGLSERIEQVAANRADPPLHVCVQTIPTVSQPTKGYLLVIVPPTPSKIHMVDGRYWGGERTRYALAGRHALGDSAARRPGPCEPAEGIGDRLVRGGRQEGS